MNKNKIRHPRPDRGSTNKIMTVWIPACAGMTFFVLLFFPLKIWAAPVAGKLIGQVDHFFISQDFDREGRDEVSAVLLRTGREGYFYVEQKYLQSLVLEEKQKLGSSITELSDLLDKTIAPILRERFGEENRPGIDKDARLSILLSPSRGAEGAYTDSNDVKSRAFANHSNEREMIYLDVLSLPSGRAPGILAHEFTHLISWHQKNDLRGLREERWLEEMRAIAATSMLGLNQNGDISLVNQFVKNGNKASLVFWNNSSLDEANVAMFGQYLLERYGWKLLAETMKVKAVGMAALGQAFANLGIKQTFAEIFQDWALTNFINDKGVLKDYSYAERPFSLYTEIPAKQAILTADESVEINDKIFDWSSTAYRFNIQGGVWGTAHNNFRVHWQIPAGEKVTWQAVLRTSKGWELMTPQTSQETEGTFYVTKSPGELLSLTIIPISQLAKQSESKPRQIPIRLVASLMGESRPVVLRASPKVLNKDGGETLQIQGMDFFTDIKVRLNGQVVEQVKILDPDHLSLITPKLSNGPVSLEISNSLDRGFASKGMLRVGKSRLDGTLVKGKGSTIYLLQNNERQAILNEKVFLARGFNWSQVINVSEEELLGYPEGQILSYPDGVLLRFNKKIFLVSRVERRPFLYVDAIDQIFGYNPAVAIEIFEAEASSLSTGANIISHDIHPDGALIRVGLSNDRYLIDRGVKRFIPSAQVFASWGFQEKFVANISNEEFARSPWGQDLEYRDGTLLKTEDGNYWIMAQGARHRFASAKALTQAGYKLENVVSSSNEELQDYEVGEEVR